MHPKKLNTLQCAYFYNKNVKFINDYKRKYFLYIRFKNFFKIHIVKTQKN